MITVVLYLHPTSLHYQSERVLFCFASFLSGQFPDSPFHRQCFSILSSPCVLYSLSTRKHGRNLEVGAEDVLKLESYLTNDFHF